VKPSCDNGLVRCQSGTEVPSGEILKEGWSYLKYVEVDVDGLSDTVTALNDSGCQLCVVSVCMWCCSSNLPQSGKLLI